MSNASNQITFKCLYSLFGFATAEISIFFSIIFYFISLGYTPLEEAKSVSDVKLIEAIEKFKSNLPEETKENVKDQHQTVHLQTTVSELSQRVNFLETLLTEVSKIGDTLKTQSVPENAQNPETIKQLGEKLSAMRPAIENSS